MTRKKRRSTYSLSQIASFIGVISVVFFMMYLILYGTLFNNQKFASIFTFAASTKSHRKPTSTPTPAIPFRTSPNPYNSPTPGPTLTPAPSGHALGF